MPSQRSTAGVAHCVDDTLARAACTKCGVVGKKLCTMDAGGMPLSPAEVLEAQAQCPNNPERAQASTLAA